MSQNKPKKVRRFNTLRQLRKAVANGPAFKLILEAVDLCARKRDHEYYPGWRLRSKLPVFKDDQDYVPTLLSEFATNISVTPAVYPAGHVNVDFTVLAEEDDILDVVQKLKATAENSDGVKPLVLPPERYRYNANAPRYLARPLYATTKVWRAPAEVSADSITSNIAYFDKADKRE